MDQKLILISLLIRLGAAAAVSSVLVRARRFRQLLFREERTLKEKFELVLIVSIPIALGVLTRHWVKNFLAADMSFEFAIVLGVIGGRIAGGVGGVAVSIPAIFYGEWLTLPFNCLAGILAGVLRQAAQDREVIWSFSPLFDLSIYRWIRRSIAKSLIDWQTSFFILIMVLTFGRMQLYRVLPNRMFALYDPYWAVQLAVYAGTVMCVAIALKVLNNARIENKLEEQERLLLQIRLEALQSQINPHFLFNTLNSVSSLVRFNPDKAREMIVKLANILRRLMRTTDAFVPLREEVDFIDDYLDIEVVRFGTDKLRVQKELEPASLDVMVPSMMLQPLVENAIKHGVAPRIEGGSIYLRSRVADNRVVIEVEDDGVGFTDGAPSSGTGIGMANVTERLNVLYGDSAVIETDSTPGKGTLVRLTLPIPQPEDMGGSVAGAIYEARSSTSR
ncbi:periplasmic sensor signal transduction histidine kinase [Candidatus Koribacter versatilis Ellin345]|uniref:histidine kinase n=1 Tax=Koribacter versatilis (strain Ellin345) TaxID=204669 RepID=Q1IJB8_KORVE|nr:histidine kinase [Candidatus Koribacter versatilis]ABF43032.1 periplasmic sensor signal transduction histidine kinase [Candidatus Koribacter versatilis Ellin345]